MPPEISPRSSSAISDANSWVKSSGVLEFLSNRRDAPRPPHSGSVQAPRDRDSRARMLVSRTRARRVTPSGGRCARPSTPKRSGRYLTQPRELTTVAIRTLAAVFVSACSLLVLNGTALAYTPGAQQVSSSTAIHRSGVAPTPPGHCDNTPPSPCPPGSR